MPFSLQFEQEGFAIVRGVVDPQPLERLRRRVSEGVPRAGSGNARGILRRVPETAALLELPSVQSLLSTCLAPGPFVVRSLLFDKVAGANWNVPWHQDQIIAVAQRREAPGFSGWSVKEKVPHVRPPAEVLAEMLTLRFHLDPCGAENGPLKVIPGSHRAGFLSSDQIAAHVARTNQVVCEVEAGDLVVMRPLLLHASDRSHHVGHRRVVHFDLASLPLPGDLQWHVEHSLHVGPG